MDLPAPDPSMQHRPRLGRSGSQLARTALQQRTLIAETLRLLVTSADDYLAERFESDIVKVALGWHAINDSLVGPSSAGTGYVLLHDHASGDPEGGIRAVGVRQRRHGPGDAGDGRGGDRGRRDGAHRCARSPRSGSRASGRSV